MCPWFESRCRSNKKTLLIENIYKKFGSDYQVFFGNGGDRTNHTTPEVDYCIKNNIEMLWGIGGGKIQSSSDLLKNWEE